MKYTHRLGRDEAALCRDKAARSKRSFGDLHTHRLGRIEAALSTRSSVIYTHRLVGVEAALSSERSDDFYHVRFAGVRGHAVRARPR